MSSQVFFTLLTLAVISYLAIGVAAAALAYLHYIQHQRMYRHPFNQDVAGFYLFFWPVVVGLALLLAFVPRFVLMIADAGKAYLEFVDKLKRRLS